MQQIAIAWSGAIPGCGDALVDGRYAVSVPGSHIQTHTGPIPECPGGPGRYLVMGPNGHIAVQGQNDDRAWEYVDGAWNDRGPTFGPNSLIYLNDGTLKRVLSVPEYQATNGYRFVTDAGTPVSCISTYADVKRGLYGYTEWVDVAIGQGAKPDQGAVVRAWVDGVLRRLSFQRLRASGQLREMRSKRSGDAFVIVVVDYDTHETTITTATRAELFALPPVAVPSVPPVNPPAPSPADPPVGSPSVTFANHLDVVQRERAKYGATLSEAECFAVTNAVANDPAVAADGWGLTSPPSGSGVTVNGRIYRLDKLAHRAGYICDVLSDTPGAAGAQWGPNADPAGASQWAPAVPMARPSVSPVTPPANPSDADLSARVGALEAALQHAMDAIEQLEATRATVDQTSGIIRTLASLAADVSLCAKRGDLVTVSGHVVSPWIGASKDATWTGVIGTTDDLAKVGG